MIDPEKRKTIYQLHIHGISIRSIARQLQVDRNTVRKIIEQKGETPDSNRSDKINLDSELLTHLYARCDGYVQRIHEILKEEYGLEIGYSTLTVKIRALELGKPADQRCGKETDEPGQEMQHDTTVYRVKFGEKIVKIVASLIYFRFSKIRYLKFYRVFDRYQMKCFFHEALLFWKFCAGLCVIDNTNLARWYGTGKNAVIVPEMEQFANQYGFKFICHEKNHPNRKAGNERSFWTVETNFFPGRTFIDLADLNRQALQWATVRMIHRPVAKTGLIPAKAFEYEQAFLQKVPSFIMPPYLEYQRTIDQYGYIPVNANYYWVPGLKRHEVKVLRFPNDIKIYYQRRLLIEYPLAPDEVKNEKFWPSGSPPPKYQPKDLKKPAVNEERKLRALSDTVNAYLTFAYQDGAVKQRHRFTRKLYCLYQKIGTDLFDQTLTRAMTYRITDTNTIERIAVLQMKEANYQMPYVPIDEEFTRRPSYIEGRFTDSVDLSIYDHIEKGKDGSGTDQDA